jgi:type III secretory pathway lipoprotein EscJ
MKKAKVKYIKDYIDNEGVLLPDEGYKNVVMSHTKRYHNCLFLLVGLRGCSRDLMDFLTEQMDNDNLVRSDSIIRKKFMDFVNGITKGEVTYSEPSVKRAFRVLEEKGLIRSQTRGVFRVNPE